MFNLPHKSSFGLKSQLVLIDVALNLIKLWKPSLPENLSCRLLLEKKAYIQLDLFVIAIYALTEGKLWLFGD